MLDVDAYRSLSSIIFHVNQRIPPHQHHGQRGPDEGEDEVVVRPEPAGGGRAVGEPVEQRGGRHHHAWKNRDCVRYILLSKKRYRKDHI